MASSSHRKVHRKKGEPLPVDPASTLRRNPAGSPSGRVAAIYAERMRSLGRRASTDRSTTAPRIPLAPLPRRNRTNGRDAAT
jgi:hypothetical protein